MAMLIGELRQWLMTVNDADRIGIDDGGLTLVMENGDYYEIGGIPLPERGETVNGRPGYVFPREEHL